MNNRVIFFIDGINLYHALDVNPKYHGYKWLDLSKLASLFVTRKDKVESIYYFTALATWSQNKVKKHKIFIRALELKNINIVFGEFKRRDKFCPICKQNYQTYEEKQTDVNIAIQLFKLSIENKYDKAIVISVDSDLIPSIKAVRSTFPDKKIGVVIPIGRRAEALKQSCDFYMKMKEIQLKSSLLEKEIKISDTEILRCPSEWS